MDPSLKMSLCSGLSESGCAEKTFRLCSRGISRGAETTEGVWLCKRRVVTCVPAVGRGPLLCRNRAVHELRYAAGCVFAIAGALAASAGRIKRGHICSLDWGRAAPSPLSTQSGREGG